MRIDTAGMTRTSGSGQGETPPTRWLVGLPFRSAARTVRCYYVVTDADDGAHAVRVALKRAEGERHLTERGGQLAPGAPIEVQRILSDSLGNTSLTSRCPGCGGHAYPVRHAWPREAVDRVPERGTLRDHPPGALSASNRPRPR